MKLSDYIANYLSKQGMSHVFAITGGTVIHLIDSIAEAPNIKYICLQHEQAGAMAADAYSRVSKTMGIALATSGPGATNMLTGVCCAFYDSIPVLYITGQVNTFRLKGDAGVRQSGFQETDVVDIYKPITKYAIRIDDPMRIRYELEKACYLARAGRPGPVLIDIPDDIQREDIDPDKLEQFIPEPDTKKQSNLNKLEGQVIECIKLLKRAKRPVIILGWGVRLAGASQAAREFVEKLGFPVALTWAMLDMLPSDHDLAVGSFGTHGTRYANFTVQNADLILSIGSRLDTHATGNPPNTFARGARKIIVDVDLNELNKFERLGLKVDLLVHTEAKDFIKLIHQKIDETAMQDISIWTEQIATWKKRYPICPPKYYEQKDVNPYVFAKILSNESAEGDIVFVDTGCTLVWVMQVFDIKEKQRILHDFNNTAMGYALPASIGASFALGKKPIICVTGDGSLQLNLQELATIIKHQLPIKVFLINNRGYGMIQQTQDQWLDSKYQASAVEGGLAVPDLVKVATAYGYKIVTIAANKEIKGQVREVLDCNGPVICNVEIGAYHRVIPQVKHGRPNEDAEPLLDREEFLENMLVKPVKASIDWDLG